MMAGMAMLVHIIPGKAEVSRILIGCVAKPLYPPPGLDRNASYISDFSLLFPARDIYEIFSRRKHLKYSKKNIQSILKKIPEIFGNLRHLEQIPKTQKYFIKKHPKGVHVKYLSWEGATQKGPIYEYLITQKILSLLYKKHAEGLTFRSPLKKTAAKATYIRIGLRIRPKGHKRSIYEGRFDLQVIVKEICFASLGIVSHLLEILLRIINIFWD